MIEIECSSPVDRMARNGPRLRLNGPKRPPRGGTVSHKMGRRIKFRRGPITSTLGPARYVAKPGPERVTAHSLPVPRPLSVIFGANYSIISVHLTVSAQVSHLGPFLQCVQPNFSGPRYALGVILTCNHRFCAISTFV